MRHIISIILACLIVCLGFANEVVEENIQTQYQRLRVVRIAENLEHPWGIAFLPDSGILVTERPGRLNLIQNGSKTEISGLPEITATGQGGLLDIALHPDFQQNRSVYFTYSKGQNDQTATALAKARFENNQLVDAEDIFVQNRYSSPGRHYGSRIAFTRDGKIVMSIGDRGVEPERAQDLSDHAGALLRLNDDGTVPQDNPFVDDEDAAPEIYGLAITVLAEAIKLTLSGPEEITAGLKSLPAGITRHKSRSDKTAPGKMSRTLPWTGILPSPLPA